ncbi:MAG: ABC transporter ATP-binding protein [Rhizobiaceae bacterium]|nr:ABC transporter ATP-binding protein [Rhizobiaceae bacterium]
MTEPVILLDQVSLTLGQGASSVHVLKGISLKADYGETIGIFGPSGSGKSTLLMVLAGLERVDSGSVSIAGTLLDGQSEDAIAAFRGRNIGIVFQSFHLIPNMTALENVAVPLELAGEADAFAAAERELAAVGLADRVTHYPSELSGGEQQRVAIARALAPSPKILIADEPTGNLDQATGRQIADLLFAKAEERGMTLVLVTHDPALADRCGRRVAMRSGRIEGEPSLAAVSASA